MTKSTCMFFLTFCEDANFAVYKAQEYCSTVWNGREGKTGKDLKLSLSHHSC